MNSKLYKEINKLKYLNTYNRGKTLTENRILLTEDLSTMLFRKIFTRKIGTELIQSGIKQAERINLKNISNYVSDEFAEVLNKKVINAKTVMGLPTFGPGLKIAGGAAAIEIDMMLSMLQRVLRDGHSGALSALERNVLHDALAMVDDDFFKALQKQLNLTDDFAMLNSKTSTNALKKKILNDPDSVLKGLSDEILEKMGIPVSVIRKTVKGVVGRNNKRWCKSYSLYWA